MQETDAHLPFIQSGGIIQYPQKKQHPKHPRHPHLNLEQHRHPGESNSSCKSSSARALGFHSAGRSADEAFTGSIDMVSEGLYGSSCIGVEEGRVERVLLLLLLCASCDSDSARRETRARGGDVIGDVERSSVDAACGTRVEDEEDDLE